jgi:hypothetical protein
MRKNNLIISALSFLLLLAAQHASANIVFFEDFNDGSADGMQIIEGSWGVVDQSFQVSESSNFDYVVTQDVTGGEYEITVQMAQIGGYTSTGILARFQDVDHYYQITVDSFAESSNANPARSIAIYKVSLDPIQSGSLITSIQPVPNSPYLHLLAGDSFSVDLNHTYTLGASFIGNTISMYIDGDLVLSALDVDEPYTVGNAGLYSYKTEALFDDFEVNSVPIPSTIFLLGSGIVSIVAFKRKKDTRGH